MREPPRVMPLVRQVDCACSRPLWPYSVRSLDQDLVAQGRQSFLNAVERATSLICPILTHRGQLADMRALRGFGNFVLDWIAIHYRTIQQFESGRWPFSLAIACCPDRCPSTSSCPTTWHPRFQMLPGPHESLA